MNTTHKVLLNDYITNNFKNKKFIGNIIFKELVQKILHPMRLQKISEKYNISVQELLENY